MSASVMPSLLNLMYNQLGDMHNHMIELCCKHSMLHMFICVFIDDKSQLEKKSVKRIYQTLEDIAGKARYFS